MDLLDRIESKRFLGREFLVWLWWKSELTDGHMTIKGFDSCDVWLDGQLTLETRAQEVEQSTLKGAAPSATPEAREALRQGKMPTKARICITHGEQQYACVFGAETFGLSGVKIPALLQEAEDDQFYERMYLLEVLEEILGELYKEFLSLRLSPLWETDLIPAMRAWIQDDQILTPDSYLNLLAQVQDNASEQKPRQESDGPTPAPPSETTLGTEARPDPMTPIPDQVQKATDQLEGAVPEH